MNVSVVVAHSSNIFYPVPMTTHVKEQAQRLLEQLPDDATWEDLQYAIYVHQAVEAGQADIEAGRVYTSEEVRQKFKLPPRA
jgi:hypothetical protein